MNYYHAGDCEVAVIGAGHAGIEAALAAARLGLETILFTINLDAVGNMPCNPAIGGTGKGHLVRELDALGGEMGLAADKACIQYRMLNRGKGPAVHSLRAQADRRKYQQIMKNTLENQERLQLKQAMITEILVEDGSVTGLRTQLGAEYGAKAVIIATGTYLDSTASQILPATQEKGTAWFSPTLCAYLLLLMVLYASFFLNKHKIWLKRMDVVLFTINGIGGCIILFLILYSQHPFTGQNYNILWMNPLTLFPLITCIFPFMKKINGLFYLGATVMFLGFVIVMPILPQVFNLAVLPWVLTLLLRSYLRLSDIRKRHKDRIRI